MLLVGLFRSKSAEVPLEHLGCILTLMRVVVDRQSISHECTTPEEIGGGLVCVMQLAVDGGGGEKIDRRQALNHVVLLAVFIAFGGVTSGPIAHHSCESPLQTST
jgi:hypothetical protein